MNNAGSKNVASSVADMEQLRVWVRLVDRPSPRLRQRCNEYHVDGTRPVLAVLATRGGPGALVDALTTWQGPLPATKNGAIAGVIEARAENIVGFATGHPEHLICMSGTGQAPPRDESGTRTTLWVDLDLDPDGKG